MLEHPSSMRQNPTRFPYSCQAQFGMSGIGAPPAGGVSTVRGNGCVGSHSSTLTMTHTASLRTIRESELRPLADGRKIEALGRQHDALFGIHRSVLVERYQSRISAPFQCSTPS